MAKARVSLRTLNRSLDQLAKKVKSLRGKGANRTAEQEMAALHKKLTAIKMMMAGECPDHLFRSFEVAGAPLAAKKRARKTGSAKKGSAKRTRKGR